MRIELLYVGANGKHTSAGQRDIHIGPDHANDGFWCVEFPLPTHNAAETAVVSVRMVAPGAVQPNLSCRLNVDFSGKLTVVQAVGKMMNALVKSLLPFKTPPIPFTSADIAARACPAVQIDPDLYENPVLISVKDKSGSPTWVPYRHDAESVGAAASD